MAMIPYEELVAGLQQWRMSQGLAVGSSDYLGEHQGYQIGEQIVPHPDMSQATEGYQHSVGDSTSEVDAGDLEVLSEEEAGFSDADFPATDAMPAVAADDYYGADQAEAYDYTAEPASDVDYGAADQPAAGDADYQQAESYEAQPEAYDDQAYAEQPAYDDQAYAEQPAAGDQAYDDQPAYDDPAYDDQAYADQPAYDDQAYAEQSAEGEQIQIEDQPFDDGQAAAADQAEVAPSFDDQPAYDDAALYAEQPAAESPFDVGDDDATVIGEAPSAGDEPVAAAYDDDLPPPPPLEGDDGTMDVEAGAILSEEDEATRIGGDPMGGAEPPPLAPPPDDDPNAS